MIVIVNHRIYQVESSDKFVWLFVKYYSLYLDGRSPTTPNELKSPGKVLHKIPSTKSLDSDSLEGFDSVIPKTPPKKGR